MGLINRGFPGGSDGNESACKAEDMGSVSGSEKSPEEGNGNPLQYSCLENSMDRGAWWAIVHGVAKSQAQLKQLHAHTPLVFPGSSGGKESACRCRRPGFNPWVGKIPWRRKWQLTPAFLPGKFHGQRGLVGYSPWGCEEPDTNEHSQHTAQE